MIIEKVDLLFADYNIKYRKGPAMILLNTQDGEIFRLEVIKHESLESEASVEVYREARVIKSDDIYPGEIKLV